MMVTKRILLFASITLMLLEVVCVNRALAFGDEESQLIRDLRAGRKSLFDIEDRSVRNEAMEAIARSQTAADGLRYAEWLTEAHADEQIKELILELWRLRKRVTPTREFAEAIYGAVSNTAIKWPKERKYCIEVQFWSDEPRTLEDLREMGAFDPKHKWVVDVARACSDSRIMVPLDLIEPHLQKAKEQADTIEELHHYDPYVFLLQVYSRAAPEKALPLVRKALRSDDLMRRHAGSLSLEIIAGVEDALDVIGDRIRETVDDNALKYDPYKHLSPQQRNYMIALDFDAQVSNGGLEQYFFNSSGLYATECPKALRAINATKSAEMLEKVLEALGEETILKMKTHRIWFSDNPELDQRVREALKHDNSDEEDIMYFLSIYAAKHGDHFGGRVVQP